MTASCLTLGSILLTCLAFDFWAWTSSQHLPGLNQSLQCIFGCLNCKFGQFGRHFWETTILEFVRPSLCKFATFASESISQSTQRQICLSSTSWNNDDTYLIEVRIQNGFRQVRAPVAGIVRIPSVSLRIRIQLRSR